MTVATDAGQPVTDGILVAFHEAACRADQDPFGQVTHALPINPFQRPHPGLRGLPAVRQFERGVEGRALAEVAVVRYHPRSSGPRDLGCGVGRAVVHHDDVGGVTARLQHHAADEAVLVVGEDDDDQAGYAFGPGR